MAKKTVKTGIKRQPADQLKKLAVHPAAELFPMLEGPAMDALVADIKANGQTEPILVASHVLVDGRNRLEACHRLGIEVRVKDLGRLTDEAINDRVVSLNINRRHLTSKQKAAAALCFYEAKKGTPNTMTADQAAKMFGISRRTLTNARHRRDGKNPGSSPAKSGQPLAKILADFANKLSSVTEAGEKKLAEQVQKAISACQEELRAG